MTAIFATLTNFIYSSRWDIDIWCIDSFDKGWLL